MNGAKNVDIHIAVKKDARSNLNAESESSQLEIREIGEKTLERETCRGEGTLVNITSITTSKQTYFNCRCSTITRLLMETVTQREGEECKKQTIKTFYFSSSNGTY